MVVMSLFSSLKLVILLCICLELQCRIEVQHSCNHKYDYAIISQRQQLEEHYRLNSTGLTILFGHIHHAGGTAVCQLARNNTKTNHRDNCNHPLEFKGDAPTRGTPTEQLQFQQSSDWGFYAVEVKMPEEMVVGGPFLYALVLRHPYLLLLSQYRRKMLIFQFKGDITSFIIYKLKHGNDTVNLNQNYYRGEAGFILGKEGPADVSDNIVLEQVKKRLDLFSVILLTERMRATGKLFSMKFGWNTEHFGVERVNSHGELNELLRMAKQMTFAEKKLIRTYIAVDMALYHYAWCLVRQQLRAENIDIGPYPYSYLDSLLL